jgi:hypothetical protein
MSCRSPYRPKRDYQVTGLRRALIAVTSIVPGGDRRTCAPRSPSGTGVSGGYDPLLTASEPRIWPKVFSDASTPGAWYATE